MLRPELGHRSYSLLRAPHPIPLVDCRTQETSSPHRALRTDAQPPLPRVRSPPRSSASRTPAAPPPEGFPRPLSAAGARGKGGTGTASTVSGTKHSRYRLSRPRPRRRSASLRWGWAVAGGARRLVLVLLGAGRQGTPRAGEKPCRRDGRPEGVYTVV